MHDQIERAFDLSGRTAIVTGGTRGLGRAIAHVLAAAGADVAVVGRDQGSAEAVAADLPRPGIGFGCDVGDERSVAGLIVDVLDQTGRVDVLVNCAGVNVRGPATELPLGDFEEVQRVNVTGTWLMCRAVAPHMIDRGRGRIVNVASILSFIGMPNRSPYAASKGAVLALTRTLALEWAPHGITVNAIVPGPFATDMNASLIADPVAHDEFVTTIPLGRFGDPSELGPAVLLLASDASSFMTGSTLTVDGGWTAR